MARRGVLSLMVCVAAITVPLLAGCSSSGPNQANLQELEVRGFTDISEVEFRANGMYGDRGTYFAFAGGCRVVLEYTHPAVLPGLEWTLIERSSKGKDNDVFLPNPTAAKVGELDAFQYCYSTDAEVSDTNE